MPAATGIARAIGRSILEKIAPEAMSINSMIRLARAGGGGYNYQLMRQDAAKYTGRFYREDAVRALKPGTIVPKDYMVEARLKMDVKYQFHGYATFTDPETGEQVRQRVSMYTNEWVEPEDYIETFKEYQPTSTTADVYQVSNIEMTGLFHNEGWSY